MSATNRCAATKCTNNSKDSALSFFRFPKDINRARVWAMACGREDLLEKLDYLHNTSYRLCVKHFDNNMFSNEAHNRLHKEAVPSIFPALEGSSSSCVTEPIVFNQFKQDEPISQQSSEDIFVQEDLSSNILRNLLSVKEEAETIVKDEEPTVLTPSHRQTQTCKYLSADSPRKNKYRKIIKTLQKENVRLKREVKKLEEQDTEDSSRAIVPAGPASLISGDDLHASASSAVTTITPPIVVLPDLCTLNNSYVLHSRDIAEGDFDKYNCTDLSYIDHDHNYMKNNVTGEIQKDKGNIFLTLNLTEYSKVIDVKSIRGIVLLLNDQPPENSQETNKTDGNETSGSVNGSIISDDDECDYSDGGIINGVKVPVSVNENESTKPSIQINEKGEKEFKCKKCEQIYYSPRLFRIHYKKEHDTNYKYKCSRCSEVYKTKSVLNNHFRRAHHVKCDYCKGDFMTVRKYKTHLKEKHKEVFYNMCKPYYCEECDIELTAKDTFMKHLREHGGIVCPICAERFTTKAEFRSHEKTHPNQYFCEICNKGFKEKHSLTSHARVHNDPYSSFCQICKQGFKHKSYLRRHMMMRHENNRKFMCDKCPGMFYNQARLSQHQRVVHEKLKPFQCSDCDKRFSGKNNLAIHHRVMHLKLKPFQCEFCGRQFAKKDALVNHRYLHTGQPRRPSKSRSKDGTFVNRRPRGINENDTPINLSKYNDKPVDCRICGKTIKNIKFLKYHLNTHARIRKYKCEFCGLMFLHQTSKIRHEKSHEADPEHKFVCPICWKRTKTKEELDLHIKEHNNRPKRHTCKVCGEAFCRRMLLDNHVLLNHTNEEEISKKEKEIIVYGLIEATKQL